MEVFQIDLCDKMISFRGRVFSQAGGRKESEKFKPQKGQIPYWLTGALTG